MSRAGLREHRAGSGSAERQRGAELRIGGRLGPGPVPRGGTPRTFGIPPVPHGSRRRGKPGGCGILWLWRFATQGGDRRTGG